MMQSPVAEEIARRDRDNMYARGLFSFAFISVLFISTRVHGGQKIDDLGPDACLVDQTF